MRTCKQEEVQFTMAININTKRNKNATRCLYYKGQFVDNQSKLISNAVAEGVFYAQDKEPYREYTEVVNGVGRIKVKTLIIQTNDFIPDLETDDFVLYEGDLWRVVAISKDDQEKNKYYLLY